ncbi:hypothetical protein, partial [Undibacterium sp. CCC1.1]|uniref:hypothetical protein n=1 Tax=Undibacterium sp. CCC1.1 TaxID=3048602 RepID=UPI002B23C859
KAQQRMLSLFFANPGDALRLMAELRWFIAELRCHLLPDWETLPYDAFSQHQELVSERLDTLYDVYYTNKTMPKKREV